MVTRISLENGLFFGALMLAMLNVRDPEGFRARTVHRGAWWAKIPLWVLLHIVSFFLPADVPETYFEIARAGACVFLLIQLVVLLGSLYEINDRWLGMATATGDKDPRYRVLLIASTVVGAVGASLTSG